MKTIIYFTGRALQIFGIGVAGYAFFLFFGEHGMGELLKLTLIGILEFYTGTFMIKFTGKK